MKMKIHFRALIIISLLFFKHGNGRRSYYTAAVFENYLTHDVKTMTPTDVKETNLKWMEIAANEASKMGADILVFSEYGATPPGRRDMTKQYAENIPDPRKVPINPCNEKENFKGRLLLTQFSCMAQKHKMYIAANLLDTKPCTNEFACSKDRDIECDVSQNCPEDGSFMYNTAVAFDRDGTLISRYYKNHLYFEFLNTPSKPDMTTFETDFGVFTMIVCFDSVFKDIVDFTKHHKIDNLIFTTHWFDDILPLNSLEWQQAWALANHVNFLAANKHTPGNGSLGSGVYHKDHGAITYTYNPNGKMKLLIGNISLDDSSAIDVSSKVFIVDENGITQTEERGEDFPEQCYQSLVGPPKDMSKDYRCIKHQTANHALRKLEQNKGKLKSCHNEFCCYLTYEADSMLEDYYLTAFDGFNDVQGFYKWKEEICLLVRCDAFKGKPCVTFPSKAKTVFKSLELKASFGHSSIYPTVTKQNYRLAPKSEWFLTKENGDYVLQFHSESTDPLLKAGLMGRNFDEDPPFISFVESKEFADSKIHPFV